MKIMPKLLEGISWKGAALGSGVTALVSGFVANYLWDLHVKHKSQDNGQTGCLVEGCCVCKYLNPYKLDFIATGIALAAIGVFVSSLGRGAYNALMAKTICPHCNKAVS